MSKVSKQFGAMVSEFMRESDLTFRAAALESSISAAYWKDMSDGRVPSEEIISRMCQRFPQLDENELRAAAGYLPRSDGMDAVGAVEIALRGNRTISAEGKKQILDFVKEKQEQFGVRAEKS